MEAVEILVWIIQWGRGMNLANVLFFEGWDYTAFIQLRKEPAADLKVSSSTSSLLVNNHREC